MLNFTSSQTQCYQMERESFLGMESNGYIQTKTITINITFKTHTYIYKSSLNVVLH